MAERQPVLGPAPVHPELDRLLEQTKTLTVSEADLQEQRVSFAYGNAPQASRITKESVRDASKSILMTR
ncbi:hypothetical protein [Bradyrhizobium sp. STM 3809]|uniref:hypothetical protein n=1 Tax=Bradyrhizobium sp. STM 3809 TaxID=551936 RepID=UPI00024098CA|nr:hypothetical protein [Bradyrhizobium sp. STM 3809]CCE02014.1 hypothetical protein BRAS3809_5550043 [Bradyrhizobium sp. STM 3809]